ncbi:hypothetical protein NFI96_028685, partial [Prochilodus magdalenae]
PNSPSQTDDTQKKHCKWGSRSKDSYGEKRIINGRKTHVKWPWFVRLENVNTGCGGALVSDRHVLTAAHCFDITGPNGDYWQAFVGVVERHEISKLYKIKKIILHHEYEDSKVPRNDIALLTLNKPVQSSDNIHPLCLPPPDHVFFARTKCWVAGFGRTNNARSSNHLIEVSVDVIDQRVCNSSRVHNGMIYHSMLCAGDLNGGPDACQGDSGGPLMCEAQGGLWYLAGIVSWGVDCGKPNKPGVYTYIPYFLKWIHKNLH